MYRLTTLITGFFLVTAPGLSQEATFEGLGDLPGAQYWSVAHDVTADGSVVVGFSDADWGQEAFRWEDGEMESLGDLPGGGVFAWGFGVSDDGTTAVGYSYSANGSDPAPLEAFRWVADPALRGGENGTMTGLGFLPGGNNVSGSYDVSADGSVVAAYGQSGNGLEAARWTEDEGMVGLGDFDSGSFSSASRAVSADGSTIVGRGNTENGWQAFRWTEDEGMVGIGTLNDDPYLSVAEDASGDGSVIVGYSNTTEGYRAFRWTEVGGMESLGDLPGGEDFSVARSISDDGSTIVGESSTDGEGEFGEQVAFIWTEEDGMRDLKVVLEDDYGLDLTGWTLTNAYAVSEDGTVIVGSGTNPEDDTEAWRAVLGEPARDASFVTTWKTDNPGSSGDDQIFIPAFPGSSTPFNYDVYWEDVKDPGTNGTETGVTGPMTITFPVPGTYRVEIAGMFPNINFFLSSDREKVLSVEQWGDIAWSTMNTAFYGTPHLVVNATDAPDLSEVSSLAGMFAATSSVDSDFNHWDVSNVTNMDDVFLNATAFNGDIGEWDVSNVTTMNRMFQGTTAFNRDIGGWNVSNVTDMGSMFNGATAFNQDIGDWDVSSVTNMFVMFQNATAFNQDLNGWDVFNVTNMGNMFHSASAFNGNIADWDVSSVTQVDQMFRNASAFNQDISGWDVSNVQFMIGLFRDASSFNQDISGWNLSSVEWMYEMFQGATAFNQDIGSWDISGITSLSGMFRDATAFNQDLSTWDVSSVNSFAHMFAGASQFDQDVSGWTTSSAISFQQMFEGATAFDQDLGGWDVSGVTLMSGMFDNASLSTNSYDATLIGWAEQDVEPDIELGAEGLFYCDGAEARQSLIDEYGWTITGDAEGCPGTPIADISPEAFAFEVEEGEADSEELTIGNLGDAELVWEIEETEAAFDTTGVAPRRAPRVRHEVGRARPRVVLSGEPILEEIFAEGGIPPSGWTHEVSNPDFTWEINDFEPHTGEFYGSVFYDPDFVPQDEWLLTPPLSVDSAIVTFWSHGSLIWCRDVDDNCDLNIWLVPGEPGDGDDIFVGRADDDWAGEFVWSQSSFDLTELLPAGEVRIGFQYEGMDGAQIALDSIAVTGEVQPIECSNPGDIVWLSVEPESGMTAPGESTEVTVTVDAADLEPDDYSAQLCVTTNDPEVELVTIPVSLTVVPTIDTEDEVAFEGTHRLLPVAPNPSVARAATTLEVAEAQDVQIELFDTNGRRVATPFEGIVAARSATEITLDTAALAPGVYVLRVSGETFADMQRMTVVR